MEITYSLRLPRDAATVPLVRTICRDTMTRLGVTSNCRGEVALALTEACANVIQHAPGTAEYTVSVELGHKWCHIRVVDGGRGLAVESGEIVMPNPSEERGRGIALMRLLVDQLDFDAEPEEGTVVHLQKDLELEDDSLLASLALLSEAEPAAS